LTAPGDAYCDSCGAARRDRAEARDRGDAKTLSILAERIDRSIGQGRAPRGRRLLAKAPFGHWKLNPKML